MNLELTLTYTSKKEYNETGYHTTIDVYKKSIIENGFQPSQKDDDWLGEGVYFWDSMKNANWWKNKRGIFKYCVFICDLKCLQDNYVNLDDAVNMDKLDTFVKTYLREMAESTLKKPNFKTSNERRKFFCDIFCQKNKVKILSFSFEHDTINSAGFKTGTTKRRQICVRDPKCISIRTIKE